ncbi:MAG: DUF4367 domain-containing protein [Candidatus Bathyarchaeia archaeon]
MLSLLLVSAVLLAIYLSLSTSRVREGQAGGPPVGSGGGATLPINGTIVCTAEEAARLIKTNTPIRLPTYVPSSMIYVKIIGVEEVFGDFEGGTVYVFYSDEPIADTNNPFDLIYMHWGAKYEDVIGGAPDMIIFVSKLDPESISMSTPESVRKYAEENNLTFMMIGGVPAFGYEPKELPIWSQPIGVLSFYKGDLCYMISSHLPLEEMVKIAESIIEQV